MRYPSSRCSSVVVSVASSSASVTTFLSSTVVLYRRRDSISVHRIASTCFPKLVVERISTYAAMLSTAFPPSPSLLHAPFALSLLPALPTRPMLPGSLPTFLTVYLHTAPAAHKPAHTAWECRLPRFQEYKGSCNVRFVNLKIMEGAVHFHFVRNHFPSTFGMRARRWVLLSRGRWRTTLALHRGGAVYLTRSACG
jgi:hypothetical protein